MLRIRSVSGKKSDTRPTYKTQLFPFTIKLFLLPKRSEKYLLLSLKVRRIEICRQLTTVSARAQSS